MLLSSFSEDDFLCVIELFLCVVELFLCVIQLHPAMVAPFPENKSFKNF